MVRPRIDVIPQRDRLEDLAWPPRLAQAKSGNRCDIYFAFTGMPALRPAGYLVTGSDSVNDLVAFCPLDPRQMAKDASARRELSRQLRLANEIAAHPEAASETGDAVWLGRLGSDDRPAPHWIYGLSCMPLTRKWSGTWVHPTPFCPKMLAAMAAQPKAAAWLHAQRQNKTP